MPTEKDSSTSSAQLGEATDSNQAAGSVVDQVFLLFEDYLQNQLEMKTEETEQKSKIDKEVARQKYRGNQNTFDLNTTIDSIFMESVEALSVEVSLTRSSNETVFKASHGTRRKTTHNWIRLRILPYFIFA